MIIFGATTTEEKMRTRLRGIFLAARAILVPTSIYNIDGAHVVSPPTTDGCGDSDASSCSSVEYCDEVDYQDRELFEIQRPSPESNSNFCEHGASDWLARVLHELEEEWALDAATSEAGAEVSDRTDHFRPQQSPVSGAGEADAQQHGPIDAGVLENSTHLPSDDPRVFGSFLFDLVLQLDAERLRCAYFAPDGVGDADVMTLSNRDFNEIGPVLGKSSINWPACPETANHCCACCTTSASLEDRGSPYTEIVGLLASYATPDGIWKALGPERFRVEAEKEAASGLRPGGRRAWSASGEERKLKQGKDDGSRPEHFRGVPAPHLHEGGAFLFRQVNPESDDLQEIRYGYRSIFSWTRGRDDIEDEDPESGFLQRDRPPPGQEAMLRDGDTSQYRFAGLSDDGVYSILVQVLGRVRRMQRLLLSGSGGPSSQTTSSIGESGRAGSFDEDENDEKRSVFGLGESAMVCHELATGICSGENVSYGLKKLLTGKGAFSGPTPSDVYRLRRLGWVRRRSRTDPTEVVWTKDSNAPDPRSLPREDVEVLQVLPPAQVEMQQPQNDLAPGSEATRPALSDRRLAQIQRVQQWYTVAQRPLLYSKYDMWIHKKPWYRPQRRGWKAAVRDRVADCCWGPVTEGLRDCCLGRDSANAQDPQTRLYFRSGMNAGPVADVITDDLDLPLSEEEGFLTTQELQDYVSPVLHAFLEEVKSFLLYRLTELSFPYRLCGKNPCGGLLFGEAPEVVQTAPPGEQHPCCCCVPPAEDCSSNAAAACVAAWLPVCCGFWCCPLPKVEVGLFTATIGKGLLPAPADCAKTCVLQDVLLPKLQRAARLRIEAVAAVLLIGLLLRRPPASVLHTPRAPAAAPTATHSGSPPPVRREYGRRSGFRSRRAASRPVAASSPKSWQSGIGTRILKTSENQRQ
ncbi:unnamed protein product [Amoebophrya sp. A120]|nr:unnamed protein product [Amoebophrya sp. A120]|eukprot:GSA120T00002219001.1